MVRSPPPSLPASPRPYSSPGPTPTRASGSRQSAGGTPTRARAAAGEMDLGTVPPSSPPRLLDGPLTEVALLSVRASSDAPTFNPKAFYAELVEKASLADLLRVQADMSKGAPPPLLPPRARLKLTPSIAHGSAEIRRLDQEKHDLIYGRHHDLVAASSTIQRVRRTPPPPPPNRALSALASEF